MGKSVGHRVFDASESLGYGIVTVAGGAVTIGFATVTVGLVMTGIGIPVAILTGLMTLGCASGTTYTGSKTVHKISHVFGGKGHCHSLSGF